MFGGGGSAGDDDLIGGGAGSDWLTGWSQVHGGPGYDNCGFYSIMADTRISCEVNWKLAQPNPGRDGLRGRATARPRPRPEVPTWTAPHPEAKCGTAILSRVRILGTGRSWDLT